MPLTERDKSLTENNLPATDFHAASGFFAERSFRLSQRSAKMLQAIDLKELNTAMKAVLVVYLQDR